MALDFCFVFDHTIFNDIYRTYGEEPKELQKYSEFIQDYLIVRRAMIQCGKLAVTSREVFDRIVSRTIINPKNISLPNIWIALIDLVDISGLTYSSPDILYKESVLILAVDLAFKSSSSDIVLLSNSKKAVERVLILYAKYARPLRDISEAPFKVMNCKEAFEYLKENDELFNDISSMLKENYEFLE